jgi:hexosaminidase
LSALQVKEVWIEPPTFSLRTVASGDSVDISFQRNDIAEGAVVRYTLDGTTPSAASPEATQAMRFATPLTFRGGLFYAGSMVGSEAAFAVTQAFHSPVQLKNPPSEKYKGTASTLTDGILGGTSLGNGAWIGFEGEDCEALVDLGRTRTVHEVSLGYLIDGNSWIFSPVEIRFELSADGKEFKSVDSWQPEKDSWGPPARVARHARTIDPTEARYVRVLARNRGTCPPNHPGQGGKAWIFLDEILVR